MIEIRSLTDGNSPSGRVNTTLLRQDGSSNKEQKKKLNMIRWKLTEWMFGVSPWGGVPWQHQSGVVGTPWGRLIFRAR